MANDVNIEIVLRGLRRARSQLNGFSSSLKRTADNTARSGAVLTAGLSAPIAALTVLSTKAAIDFESAFAGVRKTVTATDAQLSSLRAGIRQMSTEIPASTTAISGVAEAAGQLGISTNNILGFTKTMIDLGNTTNLSADQAATSLARFANITKLPESEIDRLGSTVVALGNNLATTEAEIVNFALQMAAAGKIVGLTESDTLAFAGALSSVGISAEAGSTAMSKTMVKLAKAVKIPGDELELFAKTAGLSVAEFTKVFEEDASQAIVAFIEGLGKVEESGGSVFQTLEDLALSDIRVQKTLLSAAEAGDLLREALDLGKKSWEENTALTLEANQRYATLASQIEVTKGKILDIFTTIGEQLLPIIREMIDGPIKDAIDIFKTFAEKFAALDADAKKLFVGRAAVLALGGPALLALAALVKAFDLVVVSLLKMSFATLTNPLILIPVLTAGAVAGLGSLGMAIGDTLSGRSSSIGNALNQQFKDLNGAIKELTFGIIDFGKEGDKNLTKAQQQAKKAEIITRELARRKAEIARVAAEREAAINAAKLADIAEKTKIHNQLLKDEDQKLLDRMFASIRAEVDEKARSLFKVQEFRRQHAKAVGNIEKRKGEKILADAQKEFAARLTLQKSMVVGVEKASDVIRKAIGGQVQSSSDVWKDFFSSVVDILAQMAAQAITKAAIIGAQMAIATAGITLVIGLLASVFGGRKKKDTQIRDAVDNFLKEVKRSLESFEDQVLSTLQRVRSNANRAQQLSVLLQRRLAVITKLQSLSPQTGNGRAFFRHLFDETSAFFKELTELGSNTANPRERFRDLIKEQILLLTKNSQETLDLINAEFDLKKANINEVINLLQREKDFIRGIDRSITDVTREFFTPDQLFEAQKSDIALLRQSLVGTSGEEKLTILADLKAALLASFETAKTVFAPKNQQQIQNLRRESIALTANATRTPEEQSRLNAINNQIAQLASQDARSEGLLMNWQENVISGLEEVKTAGQSTFQGLIDLQLEELRIDKASLVTEQGMRQLLKGIANASALSIKLLGQIAKSPTTTSAATISELSSALSVIFPSNNTALANILSAADALPGAIPQFASGGFVNKPTLAVVGERGPEVIARIEKNAPSANSRVGSGITVQNVFQGPLINDEISLIKWTRRLQTTLAKEQKRFV